VLARGRDVCVVARVYLGPLSSASIYESSFRDFAETIAELSRLRHHARITYSYERSHRALPDDRRRKRRLRGKNTRFISFISSVKLPLSLSLSLSLSPSLFTRRFAGRLLPTSPGVIVEWIDRSRGYRSVNFLGMVKWNHRPWLDYPFLIQSVGRARYFYVERCRCTLRCIRSHPSLR